MILKRELQFTNPYYFNDPFDCHPGLFNTINPPKKPYDWPPADFLKLKAETDLKNMRCETWVSCLSKTYDNILLWSYYTNHKGVCIGLNQDALDRSLRGDLGLICNAMRFDVEYKRVIEMRPNYFKSEQGALRYLLTSKSDVWQHEKEVRYCIYKPHPWLPWRINRPVKDEEVVDTKEVRYYPAIDSSCFQSVYLGCRISDEDKNRVLVALKKLACEVEIYQMEIDPYRFELVPKRIL